MLESLTPYLLITGTIFIVLMIVALIVFVCTAKHVESAEEYQDHTPGSDLVKPTERIASFRQGMCHPSRIHSCPMAIPRFTFKF